MVDLPGANKRKLTALAWSLEISMFILREKYGSNMHPERCGQLELK